jgi:hypothetical protein
MTNTQLYLAIGVPILFNTMVVLLLVLRVNSGFAGVNERFNHINARFDDMRDLWRAELRRVEEVLDARLKHMEERRP